MADALGTRHHVVRCDTTDIADVFPDVIWHTETPVLRAAPAPMYLLSRLVRDHGLKVVLTGEGADEILAGYNIFKEMKVRRFWARDPGSELRPQLLARLYPYIPDLAGNAYLTAFFRKGLEETASPFYSHALRWSSTGRLQRCFLKGTDGCDPPEVTAPLALPEAFDTWSALAKAQYLEMTIFLPYYLLSSQGDRMAMAHSVEGRFPFLDHRVVEFCNRLPPEMKLRGLKEKWLLKQLGSRLVPEEIWQRTKQPYRAPIQACFYGERRPSYVDALLSEAALRETDLFKPVAVARLQQKIERGRTLSEMEEMALMGILSTQLVVHQFIHDLRLPRSALEGRVKVVDHLYPISSRSKM
jgi:asparagine synthase (glutamine-hydrolysing)